METLADRITRDGPVSELDAIGWAIRLAKRLEALHALGVAHGSVSPACILTSGQDRNARAYLADVQHTTPSPIYQSPERILGGDISTADDVWALAGTLYALLTGQAPFVGASDGETRQKIFAATPAPLAVYDVGDDDLQSIIDRAFARDIGVRTHSVVAFRRALEEWHPDRGVANLPPLEDEDSTNDDDDIARTVMVRDASAFLNQLSPAPGPAAPAAAVPKLGADDDDDEDDDNVRTVMRSMPNDDLASMIAKARAAAPPTGPHPGPRPSGSPGMHAMPAGPPYPGNNSGTLAMPPQIPGPGGPGGPPRPAAGAFPRPAAGALPVPQGPPRPGFPGGPGGLPPPAAPSRPGALGMPAPGPGGSGAHALNLPAPQPPLGPRPGVGGAGMPPFGGPAPAPVVPTVNDDDDDDDDNARTMMRSPDQMAGGLDAPQSPPGRAPLARPAAGFPAAPAPQPPAHAGLGGPIPASWKPHGVDDDGPAPAATMALPAFDDSPPNPHFGGPHRPDLGGAPPPMGGAPMDAMGNMMGARPGPPGPPGGFGDMAAPGDLSALEGPPHLMGMGPQPGGMPMGAQPGAMPMGPMGMSLSGATPMGPGGMPMAPLGAPGGPMQGPPGIDLAAVLAQPPPQKGGKLVLVLAALVALLIAAGVTFLILRSRAGG